MEPIRDRSLTPTRLPRSLVALAAAALAVSACGGPGATTGPTSAVTTTPATQAPATTEPASDAPASMAAGITLELATAEVGEYVAGEGGMSLYILLPDAAAPGKSMCNGDCAANWPALVVDDIADVAAGTGVTGELGTITRDDGATQVTLGGNPLYYFVGDAAAGDTNGQGIQDVWYLAGPDGAGIDAPQAGGGRNY